MGYMGAGNPDAAFLGGFSWGGRSMVRDVAVPKIQRAARRPPLISSRFSHPFGPNAKGQLTSRQSNHRG